jgi:hypothetical protein
MHTGRFSVASRLGQALLFLALAYAVGATTWNESTQALAREGPGDDRGILIALFGGVLMMLLLLAACIDWGRRRS